MRVSGHKVARPTKSELCADIARVLNIPEPASSTGSSIDSTFLDRIHEAIAGGPSGGSDTYRKTERVLQRLGLTYDPYWDTSEAAPTGGGTVTTRAYSRIRSALTQIPRCFIVNVTDAPVGARWETDHTSVYRYDTRVSGRQAFNDAGPGSRIVYYSTSNSSQHRMMFVAHADVEYVASGWDGPWEARLANYEEFDTPVPSDFVTIPGWNHQNAITEITWDTFRSLLAAGGLRPDTAGETASHDPGGDTVAERVQIDFDFSDSPSVLYVPQDLPRGHFTAANLRRPGYEDEQDSPGDPLSAPRRARDASERKRDKLAEERAVSLATAALHADGWRLVADRQKDGVGYDLEFRRDQTLLKVEVKGIQGPDLVFDLTPKELWRAESDQQWVLIAVTNVLSPREFQMHLVERDRLVRAPMAITGYRVAIAAK